MFAPVMIFIHTTMCATITPYLEGVCSSSGHLSDLEASRLLLNTLRQLKIFHLCREKE